MSSETPVDSRFSRCPACGQRLDIENTGRCPLCNFEFSVDTSATGDDATPFATAFAHEESGRRRMCEWVWFAGSGRLKHLTMMRASAAARSFARLNNLLLAGGLGLVQAAHHGWRSVTASAALEPTGSVTPFGRGWLHIAATPNPYRATQPLGVAVDLWWNPPQAVIAGVAGFVAALVVIVVLHAMVRFGVSLAHRSQYRHEQRMTAALLYSTAWVLPLLLSAILLTLRPLGRIGAIRHWSWCPSQGGFDVAAGLVTALGVAFWWFWLIRLGATAPADSRGRVGTFFGLGTPLIVVAGAAAWWFGLDTALHALFASSKLEF